MSVEFIAVLGISAVVVTMLVLVYADDIEDGIRAFVDFVMGRHQ